MRSQQIGGVWMAGYWDMHICTYIHAYMHIYIYIYLYRFLSSDIFFTQISGPPRASQGLPRPPRPPKALWGAPTRLFPGVYRYTLGVRSLDFITHLEGRGDLLSK